MSYEAIYDPDTDADRWWTAVCALAIVARMQPGSTVLELGCATGQMTSVLWSAGMRVTAVDRSEAWVGRGMRRGLTGVEWVVGDVATLDLERRFDHVVAGNLIGEVDDPGHLLATMADHADHRWGRLHVTTGNLRSLHRIHGRAMGIDGPSHREDLYGVSRVYDVPGLVEEVHGVKLRVTYVTTLALKPYPNQVMEALPDQVRGDLLRATPPPGLGAMIYLEAAI